MPSRTLGMAIAAVGLTIWNGVAHADGGQREEPAPVLLPLEPITVPIIDHGELMGCLEVRAMWRLGDAEALAAAQERLPQLRAALVDGAAEHARLAAAPSRAVDPRALAGSMAAAARSGGFTGELLVLEASTRSG